MLELGKKSNDYHKDISNVINSLMLIKHSPMVKKF